MSTHNMDQPNPSSNPFVASFPLLMSVLTTVGAFSFQNVDAVTKVISCLMSCAVGLFAIRYYIRNTKK